VKRMNLLSTMGIDMRHDERIDQADRDLDRRADAGLAPADRERIMALIGRFSGGLAHTLNNVFAVIISNAQFNLRELEPGSELHADLSDILTAAKRGVALVDELRAVGGRQTLRSEEIDLNALVGELHGRLKQAVGERVALVVSLARQVAPIRADRARIEQVILRLAEHARGAMPDGGTLTIASEEAPRPGAGGELGVALVIRDSGPPLSAEALACVFDPYYPIDSAAKANLSLAAAHGIVFQSGGVLTAGQHPAGGTVFCVWFPAVSGV
jgi:two-component system cell cycle sensor histidine kinase/response regulator CckA